MFLDQHFNDGFTLAVSLLLSHSNSISTHFSLPSVPSIELQFFHLLTAFSPKFLLSSQPVATYCRITLHTWGFSFYIYSCVHCSLNDFGHYNVRTEKQWLSQLSTMQEKQKEPGKKMWPWENSRSWNNKEMAKKEHWGVTVALDRGKYTINVYTKSNQSDLCHDFTQPLWVYEIQIS